MTAMWRVVVNGEGAGQLETSCCGKDLSCVSIPLLYSSPPISIWGLLFLRFLCRLSPSLSPSLLLQSAVHHCGWPLDLGRDHISIWDLSLIYCRVIHPSIHSIFLSINQSSKALISPLLPLRTYVNTTPSSSTPYTILPLDSASNNNNNNNQRYLPS